MLISGCSGSSSFHRVSSPTTPASVPLGGKILGGQQPVQGASVQLYAAGSAGYGKEAKALTPAVYTDENGDFAITASYKCPSGGTETYLVATGGNPGTGSDNPAIALMAALGPCDALSSMPSIVINEVTTVASVWALAPFIGREAQVGTSAANAQGLLNAFANVNNLVDLSTGAAPGAAPPTGASIPVAKINSLANILAACVNSSGSRACNALFSAARPPGGPEPANTLDAALNIARNPSMHVAALWAIAAPLSPFQPELSSAPPDWMVAVSYVGGGLHTPGSIAVDATGNVWVANYFSSVTELSNSGRPLSPADGFTGGGLNESYGISVDTNGSVWVTNEVSPFGTNQGHGNLTVLNSSGQVISPPAGYFGGGVYFPASIAADTDGSVWTANFGDSTASRLSAKGSSISGSGGFGVGRLDGPVAVAIDGSHDAWFANYSADSGSATRISANGSQVTTFDCCGEAPAGIATDSIGVTGKVSKGHIWTANFFSNTISELELKKDGTVETVSKGYSGGGLNHPNGISVDGAGNVWVGNFDGNTITELQGANSGRPGEAISSRRGFGVDAALLDPYGIAIDSSGNVWVSNQGSSTITQFVGAATPVKTPLAGPAELP